MRNWRSRVGVGYGVWTTVICCCVGQMGNAFADEGEDLYFGANALYNRKLYDLAVKEYESFLTTHPEHAKAGKARMGLGLSYYSLGKYAESLPHLEKTVVEDAAASAGQVRLLVGQSHLQLKALDKAITHFQALASNAEANPILRADAYAGWCEALYLKEAWAEVITASDALWAFDPTGPRALRARFQGAAARHHRKAFKESAAVLLPLVDQIKDSALKHQALFLLAECERETGDAQSAETHYALTSKDAKGAYRDQALFRLGFIQFARSGFEESTATFTAFVKRYPKHSLAGQANVYIGRALLEQKSMDEAEMALQTAVAGAPQNWDAVLWLARVYSRSKRFPEAVKVLSTAATKDDAPREILFDLANAQMVLGQHAKAAESFKAVYAQGGDWPQAPDALRLQAVCLHRAGKHPKSLAACALFLKTHPKANNTADVQFLLGENQFLNEANDDAFKTLTQFLATHAKHGNRNAAVLRTVQILYGQKKWGDALKQAALLPDASGDDAFFAQADFISADCYYNQEEWAKAASGFDAFTASRPKGANADTALVKAALSKMQLGQNDAAVADLVTLVKTHPKSAHVTLANVELGRLKYESKDLDAARTYLDAAMAGKGSPDEMLRATYYQAWIALAQNRDVDAETRFATVSKSTDVPQLVPDAILQLGLLHVKRSAYDRAISHLSRFLKEYPKHAKTEYARFYLGVALARSDKHKDALPHFQAIASAKPASSLADRALYEWAWCAKGLDDTASAVARYKTLLASHVNSPLALRAAFELSELESEAGDMSPAIERLETLLAKVEDAALRSQILYRLGWCKTTVDNGLEGATLLEELVEQYPKSDLVGLAHYHAGQTTLKSKEYTRSRGHFEQAVAATPPLGPEFAEIALLRLGETQGLTSDWAASGASFDSFFERYPKSVWMRRAQLGKGWALENLKSYIEAMDAYAHVLKDGINDKASARAQFQVGECCFAMKDYDRALKEFLKVEVKYAFPEWVSKSMLELGRTLEQKGDKVLAVEQYELLQQKFPNSQVAGLAKKRIAALSK